MKIVLKRLIAVSLIICIFLSIAPFGVTESASVYSDAISSVMDTFVENDSAASNINHQILNGRYRTVQMLEIIAYELDTKGVYADAIDAVMNQLIENDTNASNINHQILNGAYRTVQMLEIIAYELDITSTYGDAIDRVMDTLIKNDSQASNINHQIQNGTYRTVQMLEIIAYESIPDGTISQRDNNKNDVDMTPDATVDDDL